MKTSKEEMMVLLRELHDLQISLSNSLHEISLNIYFDVRKNSFAITISSKADGYKTEIFEILGAYIKELDTNKVQFSQQGVSQDKIKINQLCETLKLIYEYFKKIQINRRDN